MITPTASPPDTLVYCIDASSHPEQLEVGSSYVIRSWVADNHVTVVGDTGMPITVPASAFED